MQSLSFAVITDLHFGPEARHRGKLRKLSHRAAELTEAFATEMRETVRPDFIVNLGDDIEDESHELDKLRYGQCQTLLRASERPIVNVAGNHDLKFLSAKDLLQQWRREGALHYSFDVGGVHFVVLHTQEETDRRVTIDVGQLSWLSADLAATKLPAVVFMHHSAADQILTGNRWFEGRPQLCLIENRVALRSVLVDSGKVKLVMNGHLHWNNFVLQDGIPFVTVQSLIENLDDDAPGRAAASHAICRLSTAATTIQIHGQDPARYQLPSVSA